MTLRRLYLTSLAIVMLVAMVINGWHIHRVTENVRTQFGEAAFQVTKSTVESMLANQFRMETLVFSSTQTKLLTTIKNSKVIPISQPDRIERSIDLALKDQQHSRSISLTRGSNVFDIPIPRTEVEQSLTEARYELLSSSLIIFGLSLLLYSWLTKKITQPLKHISDISQLIGAGEFGVKVKNTRGIIGKELSNLVTSINKMSVHLLKLEQQKTQLQEQKTTIEISDIARGLAHSIRNPLHTISLAIDMKPMSDDEFNKQNSLIKQQIHRIDKHIKSLMIITTHETLTSEPIQLDQLLNEIINELNTQFEGINITLVCVEKITVIGLQSELYSVFLTLISNACEACANSAQKDVTITLEQNKSSSIINITDTGTGLDKRIKKNLFLPHNTNKPYGAGMGLYIASKVIKGRYQGTIEYLASNNPSDKQNSGSQFYIEIKDRVTQE